MDVAHPPPPGPYMKLDGEWQRQWIYLYCWIGLSVVLSLGSFVWWIILRKRDRDAWIQVASATELVGEISSIKYGGTV